jgi:dipeptide/tripeptide permease
MNSRMLAVILIALGIVVLAYSGISFRTRGQPVELGPLHVETTQRHFIPPVAGAIALVAGLVLLVVGNRKE